MCLLYTSKDGIKLDIVKDIKEVRRGRIKEYVDAVPTAVYTEGKGIWTIPCDIALPCATQNELNLDDAKALKANGCFAVAEGANMPSTREATDFFQENGMMFMPGKAANAGGVATSALEMSQNSLRMSWSFEEVDEKLHDIMVGIYAKAADAAERYGVKGNYVAVSYTHLADHGAFLFTFYVRCAAAAAKMVIAVEAVKLCTVGSCK